MGNCQWLMEGTCYGSFLERKRSRWLLTHHQPCGWSPALEKGGYMAHRAYALVLQARARGPSVYPPFARAGDRCACAMVVG